MTYYQEYRNLPEDSTIRQPGKFEGAPRYAPELYGRMLDGWADDTEYDESDTAIDVFNVDPNEDLAIAYPEIAGKTVRLWEDGQGFVHCDIAEREGAA